MRGSPAGPLSLCLCVGTHWQVVDVSEPCDFSWQLQADRRAESQTAYQLQAATHTAYNAASILCDTGTVHSNATLCQRQCDVSKAQPGAAIFWRVRAAGVAGELSTWAEGPTLLASTMFSGEFVAAPTTVTASTNAPVRLRASVPLPAGTVRSAMAFVASPGYYQLWSGGQRVNADAEYGPWAEWNSRVYYDCWNVTDLLLNASARGDEAIVFGLRIGPGTYGHGALTGHWSGPNFARGYNASALPLLFELHLDVVSSVGSGQGSASSQRLVFASGASVEGVGATPLAFFAHADPILNSDWYQGEVVNNMKSADLDKWDTISYSTLAPDWSPAVPYAGLAGRQLTPTPIDPIVRLPTLKPVRFFDLGGGKYSWDLGQNFGGYAELDVPAKGFANTTLTVRVGEETDGSGGVSNGRSWWSNMGTLVWTLRGEEEIETLRQTFMFMGFQYLAVENWPAGMPKPTVDSLRGIPTSTLSSQHRAGKLHFGGVAPSADIASSFMHPQRTAGKAVTLSPNSSSLNCTILAGVFHAIIWGQQSNFQAIPGDCPNRGALRPRT